MFCSHCGNLVNDGAYVCPNCGYILKTKQATKLMQIFFWGSMGFSVMAAIIVSVFIFFYKTSTTWFAITIQGIAFLLSIVSFFCSMKAKEEVVLRNCVILHLIWEVLFSAVLSVTMLYTWYLTLI